MTYRIREEPRRSQSNLILAGFCWAVVQYYLATYYHGLPYPRSTPLGDSASVDPTADWKFWAVLVWGTLGWVFWKVFRDIKNRWSRATTVLVLTAMPLPVLVAIEKPNLHAVVTLLVVAALYLENRGPAKNEVQPRRVITAWQSLAWTFVLASFVELAIHGWELWNGWGQVSLAKNPSIPALIRELFTHPIGTHPIEDVAFGRQASALGLAVGLLLGVASIWRWRTNRSPTRFELLSWAVFTFLAVSPRGSDQRLIYLLIPFLAFLLDDESPHTRRSEVRWGVFFALLLIPKDFRILAYGVGTNDLINALLILGGLSQIFPKPRALVRGKLLEPEGILSLGR